MMTQQTARATILTILGSLRHDSVNRRLRDAAAVVAPSGLQVTHWTELHAVPPFSEDDEPNPTAAVIRLRRAIAAAAGVLVITPEYNGSLPGQLKNALDWTSRPYGDAALTGKPVAVIGASPGPGGTTSAQQHAHVVLTRSGARPVSTGLAVQHANDVFTGEDASAPLWLRDELHAVLAALAQATGLADQTHSMA